jgi:hypothetical protein
LYIASWTLIGKIVNKYEFGDSSKTLNGKGEFKFTTREGVGVGEITKGI